MSFPFIICVQFTTAPGIPVSDSPDFLAKVTFLSLSALLRSSTSHLPCLSLGALVAVRSLPSIGQLRGVPPRRRWFDEGHHGPENSHPHRHDRTGDRAAVAALVRGHPRSRQPRLNHPGLNRTATPHAGRAPALVRSFQAGSPGGTVN